MEDPRLREEQAPVPHYQSVNDVVQVALERMRQERTEGATEPERPATQP